MDVLQRGSNRIHLKAVAYQEFFPVGGLTNSVEDKGQRKWGSGGVVAP
jgi:hypothetical protein